MENGKFFFFFWYARAFKRFAIVFQSSSSTESDSIPFANENAGTIKQRARCQGTEYAGEGRTGETQGQEPADVLSDIGNMLANLTDELDAMLEEEKRQGLNME